jgi:prepilin peptidase CpaA
MLDEPFKYGLLAMLAIALLVAAVTDLRSRRIGNWLTGAIALGAPLFWWASAMPLWANPWIETSIAAQLAVALVTFAVLAVLFAVRAMGGGDVKLLTALALWIEPTLFLTLILIMALLGGLLTIVFGAWHVMRRRHDKLAIPYGVAISLAALWTLYVGYAPALTASGLAGT